MIVRPFDPERLLVTLTRHGVRFVVIGGIAGRLHGSTSVTNDLDVCYARDRKNLEALSKALIELHARLRDAPNELPFRPDPATLAAGDNFTLSTDRGNLDCFGTPAGSRGFQELIAGAVRMQVGGVEIAVVTLEDLIRLKSSSARPKDLIEVEVLSALKQEIERSERDRER